ncbi:MAG: phosphotransferase [Myxococcota bacterium]
MILPEDPSEEDVQALLQTPDRAEATLRTLERELNLKGPFRRFPRGSCLVAGSDREVLKVFRPEDIGHAQVEAAALEALDGALPVPTPALFATGVHRGWPYVRMSRLQGQEAAEAFDRLSDRSRCTLARSLGEILAALHAAFAPETIPRPDWASFERAQRHNVRDRHARRGCPEAWVDALEPWLAGVEIESRPTAWLHTEIMLEHLLVSLDGSSWCGLFDFEPSWVAPVEYELASVGLFVSRADGRLLRHVREGMGWASDPDRPRRLLAMALLHRYADLGWYLRRLGTPESVDLDRLAQTWFGEA